MSPWQVLWGIITACYDPQLWSYPEVRNMLYSYLVICSKDKHTCVWKVLECFTKGKSTFLFCWSYISIIWLLETPAMFFLPPSSPMWVWGTLACQRSGQVSWTRWSVGYYLHQDPKNPSLFRLCGGRVTFPQTASFTTNMVGWSAVQLQVFLCCEAFLIIYKRFFSSDRVYAKESGNFWLPAVSQTTPESFERSLFRPSVPAWWGSNWLLLVAHVWMNTPQDFRVVFDFCV